MPSRFNTPSRRPAFRPLMERLEDRITPGGQPLPTLVDPELAVRVAVEGLVQPTSIAFLGNNDFFVNEKASGQVKRVVNGAVTGTVLDLGVNSQSERGLLGLTLHPDFASNGQVFLYWTCRAASVDGPCLGLTDPTDTGANAEVPLLGNRVDRFVWNGSSLTFDQPIVQLRAAQPPNPPVEPGQFGNHDGGVIGFGPDGKLYIFIGDTGRRGQTQNLVGGPFLDGSPDDQFGGPEPDDAHLTGVLLRLNDDGSAPADNPFFAAGAAIGGEVGENIQMLFSYGHRNGIGFDFDPRTGDVWLEENGDNSFTELNRVEPGMNGGWIQFAGPLERFDEFRLIETGTHPLTPGMFRGLQQTRYSPDNIAATAEEAVERLFMLPGAHYSDPEFSWRYEVAPAGLGFLSSRALGNKYRNDLFLGAATANIEGGHLFHFNLTGNRRGVRVDDPRLEDRVADNTAPNTITESESLLFGTGFGIGSDIETGPNGNLYVVSLSHGRVYEIFKPTAARRFAADLSGAEEVPVRDTIATGRATFRLNNDGTALSFRLEVADITNVVAAHIHVAPPGVNGPIVAFLAGPFPAGGGPFSGVLGEGTITADDLIGPLAGQPLSALLGEMLAGNTYVNVHTNDGVGAIDTGPGDFPGGEIRGQIAPTDLHAGDLAGEVAASLGMPKKKGGRG